MRFCCTQSEEGNKYKNHREEVRFQKKILLAFFFSFVLPRLGKCLAFSFRFQSRSFMYIFM